MAENTIIITGRLATQPETKDRGHGPVARARLAHPQGHYDKQYRQWIAADTDTAWFTILANRKTGETLATMRKGDMILVSGRFAVDEWTPQAGTGPAPISKRTDLTIWANTIAAISRKQASAPAPTYPAAGMAAEPWEQYTEPNF